MEVIINTCDAHDNRTRNRNRKHADRKVNMNAIIYRTSQPKKSNTTNSSSNVFSSFFSFGLRSLSVRVKGPETCGQLILIGRLRVIQLLKADLSRREKQLHKFNKKVEKNMSIYGN